MLGVRVFFGALVDTELTLLATLARFTFLFLTADAILFLPHRFVLCVDS